MLKANDDDDRGTNRWNKRGLRLTVGKQVS